MLLSIERRKKVVTELSWRRRSASSRENISRLHPKIALSEAGSNIMGGFTAPRSIRSRANWIESWSFGPSVNTKSYAHTSSKLGTGSRASPVAVQSCLLTGSWHVAWLHDGSRMTRECPVRFCERLGVKLPGATLPPTKTLAKCPVTACSRTQLPQGCSNPPRLLAFAVVSPRDQ